MIMKNVNGPNPAVWAIKKNHRILKYLYNPRLRLRPSNRAGEHQKPNRENIDPFIATKKENEICQHLMKSVGL